MFKISPAKLTLLAQKYKDDFIVSDGSVVKCSICDTTFTVDLSHQKQPVEQHLKTMKHRQLATKHRSTQQISPKSSKTKADKQMGRNKAFEMDLTRALIQSGIPLFKMSSAPFRDFIAKYTGRNVPEESSLRKNFVRPVFEEIIDKVRSIAGDGQVCLIVNETTDAHQKTVLHVLVMPLNGKLVRPMLLKVYLYLERRCYASEKVDF